jgi:hypothetical protein
LLVRGDKTRYKNHALQPVHFGDFLTQTKMPDVGRIKGPSEESDFQLSIVPANRACLDGKRFYIYLGRLKRRIVSSAPPYILEGLIYPPRRL